ncbi:hypothetical protein LOD59_07835 [Xylella fastidiosa subsp. multiplex]|uniref:hypothetical protein n=1 Tax=Xylella fastidiosa TaxID=2371 RepID=UPI0023622AC1|nr:hypothetical protein [Xylella fastidiosa]MDD0927548.1 hypothetical protein [Xylella fastidiosa subsp. multiplex]
MPLWTNVVVGIARHRHALLTWEAMVNALVIAMPSRDGPACNHSGAAASKLAASRGR